MASFSQRIGLKPLEKPLQHAELDRETRNRLWTILCLFIWNHWRPDSRFSDRASAVESLLTMIWYGFLKLPEDTRPPWRSDYGGKESYSTVRACVLERPWNEVLDLIEFIASNYRNFKDHHIERQLNELLEEERSAYRMVSGQFLEITNEAELNSISSAQDPQLGGAGDHIRAAIRLLGDRRVPDYPNSIKESISAVESLARQISGKSDGTLGPCIAELKKMGIFHGSMLNGFSALYGYTSDEKGIRHANAFDLESNVTFADAKFMLVACSAFVNYLVEKLNQHGTALR